MNSRRSFPGLTAADSQQTIAPTSTVPGSRNVPASASRAGAGRSFVVPYLRPRTARIPFSPKEPVMTYYSLPISLSSKEPFPYSDRAVAFAEQFVRYLAGLNTPHVAAGAGLPKALSAETLTFAYRLALALGSEDAARQMHRDGQCTLLLVRPGRDLILAKIELDRILSKLVKLLALPEVAGAGLAAFVDMAHRDASASEQARSHERFCQEQDETISYGSPLLAVASDPGAFTPAARALCPKPRMLPQLTRALMLQLLCVTHSGRGEIDTPALLAALPTDEDLRRLEGPLLSPAFQEQTALGAAIRLKELVDASRVPVQDGLNRVPWAYADPTPKSSVSWPD